MILTEILEKFYAVTNCRRMFLGITTIRIKIFNVNIIYIYIQFLFDRCPRKSAVATPAKYVYLQNINVLNGEINERSLVTSSARLIHNCFVMQI